MRANIKTVLQAVKLIMHRFLHPISTSFCVKNANSSQAFYAHLSLHFYQFPSCGPKSENQLVFLVCPDYWSKATRPRSCFWATSTPRGQLAGKPKLWRLIWRHNLLLQVSLCYWVTNIHKSYRSLMRSLILSNDQILANSFKNWKGRLTFNVKTSVQLPKEPD